MTAIQAEIHVGDVGTRFNITTVDENGAVVDISAAVTKTLIFLKPDGTQVNKGAVLTNDGTDGQLHYISEANFLNVAGIWQIQAHIEFVDTEWYSNISKFRVEPNL